MFAYSLAPFGYFLATFLIPGPPPDWSPASTPPPTLSKPRPLMEIPLNSGEKDEIDKEIGQLQEQIKQSEQNLAAQKLVMDDQIKEMTNSTIRKSRLEHLELLSHDTGVSLNEIDAMLQPIIESCTKGIFINHVVVAFYHCFASFLLLFCFFLTAILLLFFYFCLATF